MKRVLSCSGVGVGHVARRQEEFQVLRVLKFLDSDLHSGWRVRSGLGTLFPSGSGNGITLSSSFKF